MQPYRFVQFFLFLLLLAALALLTPLAAQDDDDNDDASLTISGTITTITPGIIIVDDQVVDVSGLAVPDDWQVGDTVQIIGVSQSGIIIATGVQQTEEVTGIVTAITPGTLIVGEQIVDISTIDIDDDIAVGEPIVVVGIVQNGILIAVQVIQSDDDDDDDNDNGPPSTPGVTPEATEPPAATETPTPVTATEEPVNATPEATSEATPAPPISGNLIVIVGPVAAININIITIYNFDIEVEPGHPILTLISVGQMIRCDGELDDDDDDDGQRLKVRARIVSNTTEKLPGGAGVRLEGNIQAINTNIITINNINIAIDDADLLERLRVGQFFIVEGNFIQQNNVFVFIIINVVVNVNNPPASGGGGGGGGDNDDDNNDGDDDNDNGGGRGNDDDNDNGGGRGRGGDDDDD
jgi:hypothetical protein